MESKTQETINFLKAYRESDLVVLTAIHPENGNILSETFSPFEDEEKIFNWVEEKQGIYNLYFHANPTLVRLSGRVKALKTQIRGMVTLHVDLDPRKGEDITKERERALRLIRSYNPPPSFIIDSGGGYQGFWLLDAEIVTNGSEEKAAELEKYNQQIAIMLQADPCHNLDRILRLPGTINIPDAKKRKRGRVEALASLVEWHDDRRYPLSTFTPAPSVQSREPRSGAGVKLSGNLPKPDLDHLTVKLKQIIEQGEDPEDVTRFPSRSEVLFFVCCELVRAGCDDDTIAAVILDHDLAISSSVLDKPRPTEYAARQIQRAREQIDSPELRELNDAFAVIGNLGGKCRIVTEEEDPSLHNRTRIVRQTFEDFRNRHMHRTVWAGEKPVPLGTWWLKNPKRRQYDTIAFAPHGCPGNVFNLWRGFAFDSIPGDCNLFLDHILMNICSGDPVRYAYVMDWLARMVQQPDSPGQVAIVLRGKQGTGKGVFTKTIGSLLGRHFLQISDPKHLIGHFNAHLRDCVLLFADEAFYAGDKKHESILKMLVTEETFIVEGKGLDAETARNCTHLIMASNSSWVVPAGGHERRFFVMDVGEEKLQNIDYFEQIDRQLNKGGREALLHLLRTRDINSFRVQNFPRTDELQDQKIRSLPTEAMWWYEKLLEGLVFPEGEVWITEVEKAVLQTDYETYALKRRELHPLPPTLLGKFLATVLPKGYPKSYQKWVKRIVYDNDMPVEAKVRAYFYGLPDIAEARTGWEMVYGSQQWDVVDMRLIA